MLSSPAASQRARRSASKALALIAGALVILASFTACRTTEEMAPPVDPRFHAVAAERGLDASLLERGRHLYLTDCARCHNIESVDRYTLEQWEEIVPDMAKITKLNQADTRALRTYVRTAYKVMTDKAPATAPNNN